LSDAKNKKNASQSPAEEVMDVSGVLTLPDLLRQQDQRQGGKEFLVFEDDSGRVATLTYRAFADRVNRFANALVARGIKPGENVALMMTNSPEFLVSWLAINQAGAVMVPVNVFYAADELRYLLKSSQSAAFVSEPKFLPLYAEVAADCPTVRVKVLAKSEKAESGFESLDALEKSASPEHRIMRVPPEAPSQIVYTSGTTSRPKGAVISHRASVIQGIAMAMLFGMNASDRACIVLPLFHVNAQYVGAIPALTAGATIVLLEVFSARKFWNQVRTHRATALSIVPMLLRTMLAQPPRDDDAKHGVRLSFYALPTTDAEWDAFEQRFGVRLIEGYGLSETLGVCSSNPATFGTTKRHCIGLPVLGREMRVVDDDGRELPADSVGRIQVRGQPIFSGYFNDPESTKACMVGDGWFDTGDNGSVDADGYFHFFDRSKDVIKRAGENIAASEVERVLDENPKIAESAVIAVHDALRDEAVKAFVVVKPGQTLDEDEVREWCASHLAKFKVPSFVEFRAALPRTSIGKIMKATLRAEERARQAKA
jgi:crotonobetaine/carnitine-CoA ligase